MAADQPKQIPSKQVSAKQVAAKTPRRSPAVVKSTSKAIPPKPASVAATKSGKSVTGKSAVAVKPANKKAPVYPRYYAQMLPAPDRSKEIQQALVDMKRYFSGSPDGVWGHDL